MSSKPLKEMEDPSKLPDIDYQPPQPMPEGSSGTGKKVAIGCTLGCLTLIIITVIAGFLIYNYVSNAVLAFTTDEPIIFVEPVADPATIQEVVARYDAFDDAMKNGKPAEPLVLSGEEINLLIYNHPTFSKLKGFGQAGIEEDRFTAQISVPLDPFNPPDKFKGRYLNGAATFRILLNQGKLEVYLEDLKGTGDSIPESIMSQIRGEDLMKDQQTDKEFDAIFENLEELKVEDGKVLIVPKKPEDRPQSTPAP